MVLVLPLDAPKVGRSGREGSLDHFHNFAAHAKHLRNEEREQTSNISKLATFILKLDLVNTRKSRNGEIIVQKMRC